MEQLYPEWQWEAHYTDGTILYQDDNKIRDINQDKLHSFRMVHKTKDPFILLWRPGLKLIHFYRMIIAHTPTGEERIRMYCFGYENQLSLNNSKMIVAIMPDGIVITDNIDNIKVSL